MTERAALAMATVAAYLVGYFALGWTTDPARARTLATPLDDRIPFIPETILLYVSVYTTMCLPLFVVRSRGLFRRVAFAYAVVIGVSLLIFAVFPVSGVALRAETALLDPAHFSDWAVQLLYRLDPPFNLFPSIHLSISTLAALAAWKARRVYGAIALVWLAAIAVSICTVKQHFLVDGVAGLALGCAAHFAWVRPYRRVDEASAFGWGGPLLYLMVNTLFYAGAYAVFRACG